MPLEDYDLGPMLAYRGMYGCTNVLCSQGPNTGACYGWHCPTCDAPCSMQGHDCPERKADHGSGTGDPRSGT